MSIRQSAQSKLVKPTLTWLEQYIIENPPPEERQASQSEWEQTNYIISMMRKIRWSTKDLILNDATVSVEVNHRESLKKRAEKFEVAIFEQPEFVKALRSVTFAGKSSWLNTYI